MSTSERKPTVRVYRRDDGLWDWQLVATNGEQIAESSQGYTERNDAHEGFERVAALIGDANYETELE